MPLPEPSLLQVAPGFLLWTALSALGLAASWAVAAAFAPERGLLERAQLALLFGIAAVLTAVQALGLAHALTRPALALLGLALFGGALAAACWKAPPGRLRELLRSDLEAPARLVRESAQLREPLALALPVALFALGFAALQVWAFRSWGWDVIVYHAPMTNLAIQEHGLGWVATFNSSEAGYARNLEMLAVWNVLLPRDNQLDDAAQLPFALLGMAALASWARRLGASRPLAASVGALWVLAPPVFLELPSLHNDVACGALFLTGWVWLTADRFGRFERALSLLALALYAGTKFTGAFHCAFVAPLVAVRLARAARNDRRVLRELPTLGALLVWFGGLTYLHNLFAYGNPIWPAGVEVPLLHVQLPGAIETAREWVPPFFGGPGGVRRVFANWYDTKAEWFPDVRARGYGIIFGYLTLPCLLVVSVLGALRAKFRREALAIAALFVLALLVPEAQWPRFTLCAGIAALAALALVQVALPWTWARRALSVAALALGVGGHVQAFPGSGPMTAHLLGRALAAGHVERNTLQLFRWLWSEPAARLREIELREGDVVAYDDSTYFLGELWTHDLRNRAVYIQHARDGENRPPVADAAADAAYLSQLRTTGAVWASVRRGGNAERALLAARAQPLFALSLSSAVMFRLR